MNIRSIIILFAAALLASNLTISQTSVAQETGGVAVRASAESSAPAELLRMSMAIEAQGGDFQTALEVLAEKKKKAMIGMEKLDALEDSFEFGETERGAGGDTSSMMQQLRRQMGNDPRAAKMLKIKPPVTLTITVTADWKLEGDGDELLIACDELKQKITDADIGGTKVKAKLSDEQAEVAEEMAAMMNEHQSYGGSNEVEAGKPTFYYVRTVSAEDHDKLVAEAFAKAKTKADRLVKSTGLSLGSIQRVAVNGDTDMSEFYGYDPYGRASQIPSGGVQDDGSVEAISQSPTDVPHSASIAVQYEIK
jgi:hypothetical protein